MERKRNNPMTIDRMKRVFIITFYLFYLPSGFSYATSLSPTLKDREKRHNNTVELLKRNEFDKVIRLEKNILAGDPGDVTAYLMLTIAYLGKDDERKAVELAEEVKKINMNFASEVYASMGRFYITKKRYHKGLVYSIESLKIRDDPDVIRNVAEIYLNQGLLENAKNYYERLLNSRPDYLNLSRIYLSEENYEGAIDYARKAIKEDAGNPGGFLVLGTGYMLTGRPELAKANFRILKGLNPEFFPTDYFLGIANIMQRNYQEAFGQFQNVMAIAPKLKEAYIYSAFILHVNGGLSRAKEYAAKAIELDPLDPASHIALGNIYLTDKKYDKADEEYRKAGDLFPDLNLQDFKASEYFKHYEDPVPQFMTLSLLNLRAGLYREAVKNMDAALKSSPAENPFLMIIKARAEARLKNYDKAEELYSDVIRKNPGLVTPFIDLGDIYGKKQEYDKAVEFYRKAPRGPASVSPRAGIRFAEFYAKSNKMESAAAEYRKVISLHPESVAGYKELALHLSDSMGEHNEGLKYALKGASINPEDTDIRDTLGWIYHKLGKNEEALKTYTGIMKNGTNNPLIYYHLGLVYSSLDDPGGAADSFEKALNINDEFSKSAETKDILKKLAGPG